MGLPEPSWLEEAIRKYKAKLDHVRLRPVFSTLVPQTVEKTRLAQALNDRLKTKVKEILDAEGILSDFHLGYYDYAYALDKSQRTFEFMVDRVREHQILRVKWEARGLDPTVLDKLDTVLIWNTVTP